MRQLVIVSVPFRGVRRMCAGRAYENLLVVFQNQIDHPRAVARRHCSSIFQEGTAFIFF